MTSPVHSIAQPDPVQTMFALLNGHLVEQALHVAAVLGIADRLAGGPLTAAELAADIGVDAPALYRLLRTLASIGVFARAADDHFGLTPLGDTLRRDSPNSLRDRAVFYGLPEMWPVWGNLLHSVRTGRSACEHRHGTPFYQFLIENPNVGTPFNRYMSNTSAQHNAAILDAYDFSGIATLVDIGGGHGGTLAAILGASPGLHGVLFDLPEVVESANHLDSPDMAARSRREGGDMEQGVPAGADAYLLKWVLMDRPDDRAVRLLRHCRTAMTAGGRVLVVEIAMPDDDRSSLGRVMDLQMMLLFGGGRIRTEKEFRALFAEAGLTIAAVHSTRSPNVIIEGRAIVPE